MGGEVSLVASADIRAAVSYTGEGRLFLPLVLCHRYEARMTLTGMERI